MMSTIESAWATGWSVIFPVASSCSMRASGAACINATTAAWSATGVISGILDRRDCFAAARAAARHLASPLSCFFPQFATDRPACHGTITSAPAWVSRSTVSSDRAAFGRACTTVTVGRGAGSLATQSTTPTSRSFPETPVTVMTARVPWPSTSSICSPTLVRFTLTACRPSSPVSSITSPTVGGVGNSCT